MMKFYMAPLEGITDYIFRNKFEEYFGGIDRYYTPFITPTSVKKFQTKELYNIDPEKNDVKKVVPQILTNNPEHFLWAAEEIKARGFEEVNLNLGCPSGTVVAKRKGSGLLTYPYELEDFLSAVFEGCDKIGIRLSVKTRLGRDNPDEFYEIMEIYNKFPISELTIHPRIRKDFYREPVRPEYFDWAYKNSRNPLVYNGDIITIGDFFHTADKYPKLNAIMVGRGLIMDPGLAAEVKKIQKKETDLPADVYTKSVTDLKKLREFHDDLLDRFRERLSGEKPVLFHMKDIFTYMSPRFSDREREVRNVLKAKNLPDYINALNRIM